ISPHASDPFVKIPGASYPAQLYLNHPSTNAKAQSLDAPHRPTPVVLPATKSSDTLPDTDAAPQGALRTPLPQVFSRSPLEPAGAPFSRGRALVVGFRAFTGIKVLFPSVRPALSSQTPLHFGHIAG